MHMIILFCDFTTLLSFTGVDRAVRRPVPPDDRVSSIRIQRLPVQCRTTVRQPRP